ncbi:MAG TPA: PDZ domain-containing protein [Planctomycetota bacterium]|nr:PDZ domain-containing protein [Planctomycetota bacterium]
MRAPLVIMMMAVLATPALAGDEALGDGKLAHVRVGWEGFCPRETVAPVTIHLSNQEKRERTLRVVVSPDESVHAEETVVLAPGAKKRLAFAVRVEGQVGVSVFEGGRLVESGRFTASPLPDHAVLLVDGDPDSLSVPEVATGCICVACPLEDLPRETACLGGFAGIVVRLVDPTRLDHGARAALDDYVRCGGTLCVSSPAQGPSDQGASTRILYDEASAGSERSEAGLSVRSLGLGKVALLPADVGAQTAAAGQVRIAAGDLLIVAPRPRFPAFQVIDHPNEHAVRAAVILGVFLGLYFLVAGPVFAIVLRRARPERVRRAFAILVLSFLGLGVLAALVVRSGTGSVHAFTFVVTPRSGDPVLLGTVVIQSSGGRSQDVSVEGDSVSATSFGHSGRHRVHDWRTGWRWLTESVHTERAVGAHAVSWTQTLPSFGETSAAIVAAAPGWKRIEARIDETPNGPVATVTNTLDHDLGKVVVCETLTRYGSWHFGATDKLAKGRTVQLGLRSTWCSARVLGLPPGADMAGWLDLVPACADGVRARYAVFAQETAPLAVRAPGAVTDSRAWRVQEIESTPAAPGWLGVSVEPVPRGLKIVGIVASSPAAGDPWLFRVGQVIATVGDCPVRTVEDLKRALAMAGAGARVEIKMVGGDSGMIDLADRPADADAPQPAEDAK